MKKIQLQRLCPQIFAQREDLRSEIWHQQIVFEKGKNYLIEAMSGTGKSSLCSYLCGYRDDYTGQLLFDETDARSLSIDSWTQLRQCHISHLIQDLRLFPELTAFENIEIKNNITRHKSEKEILEALEQLGIADKRDTLLGKMSFGQQQRVALIRALVQPFDFLLADEPVSHLDEHHARLMGEMLLAEARRQGAGIIVTSIGKRLPIPYDHTLHL